MLRKISGSLKNFRISLKRNCAYFRLPQKRDIIKKHGYFIKDEFASYKNKIPEKLIEEEKKRFQGLVKDILTEYKEEFYENLDRLENRVDNRVEEIPEKKKDYYYYTQ